MSDMTYAEAAEVLKRDDVSQSARAEAIEVALRALEAVEIQAQVIIRQSRDIKDMRKAMNGQSEYTYLGGDLISREALIERMENVVWYSTNDKGVLHTGAACQESAYVRWEDVADVMESALAVEAEPVVHARWEVVRGVITPGGDPLLRCPRCRSRESEHLGGIECNRAHWNCCPICGAHMDEEVSDV